MIELRPIESLSPVDLAPLLAAGAAEGFRFVARLAAEWSGGAWAGRRGRVLLGGYDGGRLVAVAGLSPDPYGAAPDVGRLRHLYVLPEVRRRGVGRRLVRALEALAAPWYDELVLRTDTAAAGQFYEALGYGRRPGGGTATHGRSLGPAAPATAQDA